MSQAQIESSMEKYFVKKAPFQIPAGGRKAIVEYSPWLALIFGILGLLTAKWLWGAGHYASELNDSFYGLSQSAGVVTKNVELGPFFYLAMLALVAQSLLMLFAFSGLKARSKARGWDLMLYGVLANLVYGIFVAFTAHDTPNNFISVLISTTIGLYILAQIRSHYHDGKAAHLDHPHGHPTTHKKK